MEIADERVPKKTTRGIIQNGNNCCVTINHILCNFGYCAIRRLQNGHGTGTSRARRRFFFKSAESDLCHGHVTGTGPCLCLVTSWGFVSPNSRLTIQNMAMSKLIPTYSSYKGAYTRVQTAVLSTLCHKRRRLSTWQGPNRRIGQLAGRVTRCDDELN